MANKRKSLLFSDWSSVDRWLWEAAIAEGDIFDGRGPVAHWSLVYRNSVMFSYGRWLAYLQEYDPSCLEQLPSERVTVERIRGYVGTLKAEISTTTVHLYLGRLHELMKVLCPDQDWGWLQAVLYRLKGEIIPRNKRTRMVDIDRLFELGVGLMDTVEPSRERLLLPQLLQHRDGLIIALLAARPIRRKNLTAITLDRHLLNNGDHYELAFTGPEMKNGQPIAFSLPKVLTPYIDRYLDDIRPLINGANTHIRLWASAKGGAMGAKAIYDAVTRRTRHAFGHHVNPHLFRDCAATTIAIKDPAHVEITKDILGHSRLETAEQYYNQARTLEASRQYQSVILAQRQKLVPGHTPGT